MTHPQSTDGRTLGANHPVLKLLDEIERGVRCGHVSLTHAIARACVIGMELGAGGQAIERIEPNERIRIQTG